LKKAVGFVYKHRAVIGTIVVAYTALRIINFFAPAIPREIVKRLSSGWGRIDHVLKYLSKLYGA
jgi:hypothetical protein